MRPVVHYSERYYADIGGHVFPMMKYRLIHARLLDEGVATPSDFVEPEPATPSDARLVHTPEYVDAVRRLSRGEGRTQAWRYNFGPGDNPIFRRLDEIEGLKVGGALTAAGLLVDGYVRVAFSFSGGLHHALPERASGF